jgi:hypothetical protein
MKNPKLWLAILVAGIVGNILDTVVQGHLLASSYAGIESMRHDTPIKYFIIGDFVGVAVLAWVMQLTVPALGMGARAGFVLGVFANFPTWHFIQLMFKGYPYSMAWLNTIYGIIWYIIIAAIIGAIAKPKAA